MYCLLQDGVLDLDEVQHWVMPDDYDHAIAESKHLIYEADTDKVCCRVLYLESCSSLQIFYALGSFSTLIGCSQLI